jgi:hypothetical protein
MPCDGCQADCERPGHPLVLLSLVSRLYLYLFHSPETFCFLNCQAHSSFSPLQGLLQDSWTRQETERSGSMDDDQQQQQQRRDGVIRSHMEFAEAAANGSRAMVTCLGSGSLLREWFPHVCCLLLMPVCIATGRVSPGQRCAHRHAREGCVSAGSELCAITFQRIPDVIGSRRHDSALRGGSVGQRRDGRVLAGQGGRDRRAKRRCVSCFNPPFATKSELI